MIGDRVNAEPFRGLVWLIFFLIALGSAPAAHGDQILLSAQIGGDIHRTRFVAFLSKKVEYRIFSIADP